MSESFTIRVASADDLPAIRAITAEVFQPVALEGRIAAALGDDGGPGWLALKMDLIAAEIRNLPDGCFVAVENGRVIGYVTNSINPVASRGYISSLAITAACQGRGVGRALVNRSLAYFRARKLRQAKIDTLDANQVGRHLYPAIGFKEAARVIHYVMKL